MVQSVRRELHAIHKTLGQVHRNAFLSGRTRLPILGDRVGKDAVGGFLSECWTIAFVTLLLVVLGVGGESAFPVMQLRARCPTGC
jgi:hypothetical protein